MRKTFILAALLAIAGIASAQNVRYVYIPGDGEHRLGLVLGPSFGQRLLYVGDGNATLSETSSIMSSIGFNAGIRWGYETEWGRTVGFGNYVSLYYGMVPFSGEYLGSDGLSHKLKYNGQSAHIYESPNMTFDLNDQMKLSIGVGLDFGFAIPGKAKVDGVRMNRVASDEEDVDLLMSIFTIAIGFDGNVGYKYFLTDDFYVGARLQYNFYTLSLGSAWDADEAPEGKGTAGIIAVDRSKSYASSIYLPDRQPVQLLFEIGYRW